MLLNPLEGGGEVDSGRAGAGGLVELGSDPSPLLHCVEASFDDAARFLQLVKPEDRERYGLPSDHQSTEPRPVARSQGNAR